MCNLNQSQKRQSVPRGFDVQNQNPLDTAELMLGTGMARNAAKDLKSRKSRIDQMVDQATK